MSLSDMEEFYKKVKRFVSKSFLHVKALFLAFLLTPHLNFKFVKLILRCHNVKKFCMANKVTIVNKFVHSSLLCNITRSAITIGQTIKKMEDLIFE